MLTEVPQPFLVLGGESILILITQNADKYEIRFPYDPELVQHVKDTAGRVWNPEGKYWSIPLARLGFFLAQIKGTKYESQVQIQSQENINVNASIDEPNKIPDVDISDVTMYVADGCYVYEHQKDTVRFAKWRYENGLRSGFILADQPGAGKSLSVCLWAMYMKEKYKAKHCLIIACVNSAKYNWREDIAKHTKSKEVPYILGTRLKKDGTLNLSTGSKEKLEDLTKMKMYGKKDGDPLPYFIILNIEAIRMRSGKLYPIADRIVDLINKKQIALIALDEVHKNCLEYKSLIQTDCGLIPIGDIVSNRLKVNVLSYDISCGNFVYRPIVDWHANAVSSPLLELTIQEGSAVKTITCTPDHELYTTNRGWVAASDLTESDNIIFNQGSVT